MGGPEGVRLKVRRVQPGGGAFAGFQERAVGGRIRPHGPTRASRGNSHVKRAIPFLLGLSFLLAACGESPGLTPDTIPTPSVQDVEPTAGPYDASLSPPLHNPAPA